MPPEIIDYCIDNPSIEDPVKQTIKEDFEITKIKGLAYGTEGFL